jgi:hypothetical protein
MYFLMREYREYNIQHFNFSLLCLQCTEIKEVEATMARHDVLRPLSQVRNSAVNNAATFRTFHIHGSITPDEPHRPYFPSSHVPTFNSKA